MKTETTTASSPMIHNSIIFEEEKKLVETWNKNHKPGEVVSIKDNGNTLKTATTSKAYLGKGGRAKVVLAEPRGHFSLHKIVKTHPNELVPEKEIKKTRKQKNNHKITMEERNNYYKLKDHLLAQLKKNENVILTKISIELLFKNIHSNWGIIKPIEQFKIFIEKHNMKILNENDSTITISKN